MEEIFVFRKAIEQEDILLKLKEKLAQDKRFISEVETKQIAVTEGFLVYPFFEGRIKNLEYLIVQNEKQKSGVIDAHCSLAARDFILRELSSKDFVLEELDLLEYNIFNREDIEAYEKEFIQRILDKTMKSICKRHNLVLTDRKNIIDISPIKDFEEYTKKYFLEEVYQIDYFIKHHKKPYRCVYSAYKDEFYAFSFPNSKEYEEFYKLYRRPIVSLPKEYFESYYQLAFEVYLNTKEELNFMKPSELLTKVKKNIKYKEYSKYEDYLNKLIFYFKRKSYLTEYPYKGNSLKEEIFYCYLTLWHNPQSGYRLAELVSNYLIQDRYLRLLEISAKQGNTAAKKALFEYYSEPKNYNEYYIKRYS